MPEFEDDDDPSSDGSLDAAFYERLANALAERISQCSHRVPVVTGQSFDFRTHDRSLNFPNPGFFGPVPGSLLAQVGRGYTDLLSAILSVALKAAELQIWKEVDGIYTADPRKVPTARLIPIISPDEAAELTYYGSEVVHAFAMEQVCLYCSDFFDCASTVLLATVQAIREMIPVRVKNVQNPKGSGTVIYPDPDVDTTREGFVSASDSGSESDLSLNPLALPHELRKNDKLPTAVTIKEHIMVLNVHSNRKRVSHGFLAGIFETLDRFGVVVDLISTSEVHVSMAIYEGQAKKVLDRLISDLRKSGKVNLGAIIDFFLS